MSKLLATKPLDQLLAETRSEGSDSLVRTLGPYNLISLGIGAIIGAGIFVLTGTAAAQFAGPAITLSFVLVGIGCAFAGLCYAEFAAMIPMARIGEPDEIKGLALLLASPAGSYITGAVIPIDGGTTAK